MQFSDCRVCFEFYVNLEKSLQFICYYLLINYFCIANFEALIFFHTDQRWIKSFLLQSLLSLQFYFCRIATFPNYCQVNSQGKMNPVLYGYCVKERSFDVVEEDVTDPV